MLALSTCWNSHRHTDGEDMLREILDLGFERIELSHGINLSLIDGVLRFAERGGVHFTSLHNFCPQPVEVMSDSPDCYEFSSSRPDARERAVKMTLQTLEYASRIGAKRVVLHLGTFGPMRGFSRELIGMVQAGQFLQKPYAERKLRGVMQREREADATVSRVVETLKPVVEAAAKRGIVLGCENRDAYESIPSEHEFESVLDALGPPCGYWHDFGHAQRKENLALLDHAAWVRRIAGRAVGCHVHDAAWPVEDHRVPFTGQIDFADLVPHFPKDIPFVFELHPSREASEIVEAAERWRKEFGE